MKNNKKIKIAFIPLFLSLCIIFLSVGYASINSITGEIQGTLVAEKQDGVFITDVVYDSNMNADISNSSINNYHKTTLNSTIFLSDSSNSAITYRVTVYNSTNDNYRFNGVLFGRDFYDNDNIVFELTNLEEDDEIIGKGYITFYITFSYLNDVVSDNKVLNSYLNFDFVKIDSDVSSKLELTYDITNSWNSNDLYYYQVKFTLTNIGTNDFDGWSVDVPISAGYSYDTGWSSSNGINFDYSNSYNLNISSPYLLSSGSSVSFTVQIAVPDSNFTIEDFIISGDEISDGVDDDNDSTSIFTTNGIEVILDKSNNWISGENQYYVQYALTVKNVTDSVINGWKVVLSVPSGSKITQAWNIEYQNNDNTIIIKSPPGNFSLEANSSYIDGGFIIMMPVDNYTPVIK